MPTYRYTNNLFVLFQIETISFQVQNSTEKMPSRPRSKRDLRQLNIVPHRQTVNSNKKRRGSYKCYNEQKLIRALEHIKY